MSDESGGTRYTAYVMHPDEDTCEQHKQLGFFDGWNAVITQLEALASGLR